MKRCGLILAVICAMLASCAAPTPTPTPMPTRTPAQVAAPTAIPTLEGPVSIVLWHAEAGPGAAELLQTLSSRFHEQHPEITVEPVYAGSPEELRRKTIAAVQAGNPPELVLAGRSSVVELMAAGALVPLDPYADDAGVGLSAADHDDIYPGFWQAATYSSLGGKMLSFPFAASALAMYYNLTALKAAGIKAPPRTWEEFEKACSAVSKGNVTGYAYAEDAFTFEGWLYSRGARPLSEDRTTATFNGAEGVTSLELLSRLATERTAWRPEGNGADRAAFAQGQAVLTFAPTTAVAGYAQAIGAAGAKFEWGVTAPPQKDPANPRTVMTVAGLCIPKSDEARQLAAWLFIRWLAGADQSAAWAAGTGYGPIRQSALDRLSAEDWPAQNKVLAQAFAEVTPFAYPEPDVPGWERIAQAMEDAWVASAAGLKAPQEALDEAAGRVQEALAAGR